MSVPGPVIDLARRQVTAQAALADEALGTLSAAVRRAGSPERWRDAVASVAAQLLALQVLAAALSDGYVSGVLDAQGASPVDGPPVNPAGFASESWLRSLVFAPIAVAGAARAAGLSPSRAASRAQLVAMSIVLTGMHDTGRAAVQASMWSQGALWYSRVLSGGACARCVVLAGRRYRSAQAFDRHPRCRCGHVPQAGDDHWSLDPREHFDSLPSAEQDRVFTAAGAQAIRDGADIGQVVNARQGVSTVTAFGRELRVTTVGTTRRALFGRYEVLEDGTLRERTAAEFQRSARSRTATEPRLLPEQIYQLAAEFGWDRAEVLRQLRRYGYLL